MMSRREKRNHHEGNNLLTTGLSFQLCAQTQQESQADLLSQTSQVDDEDKVDQAKACWNAKVLGEDSRRMLFRSKCGKQSERRSSFSRRSCVVSNLPFGRHLTIRFSFLCCVGAGCLAEHGHQAKEAHWLCAPTAGFSRKVEPHSAGEHRRGGRGDGGMRGVAVRPGARRRARLG